MRAPEPLAGGAGRLFIDARSAESTGHRMNDDHEAGCLEDTTGECLVGVATMAPTLLAAIVWPDIMNGRLRGLCVEVRGVQREDRFDVADVLRVQLGARKNDCSSGARVERCWEGDEAP